MWPWPHIHYVAMNIDATPPWGEGGIENGNKVKQLYKRQWWTLCFMFTQIFSNPIQNNPIVIYYAKYSLHVESGDANLCNLSWQFSLHV